MSAATDRLEQRGGSLFARAWRRRWVRATVRVAALAIVLRVALALAMPWLVQAIASTRGASCSYRDLDLSLLAGEIEIHDFALRLPGDYVDSEPSLAIDYLHVDLNVWRSIWSKPSIERAEIDGARIEVEVLADGRVPWLEIAGLDSASEAPDDPAKVAEPFDFTVPVEVGALRLHEIEVHVVDASVDPPLDARVLADVRYGDTGKVSHRLEARATSRELFDLARAEVAFDGGLRALAAEARVELRGLDPRALRGHLARFGLAPVAAEIDASLALEAALSPADDSGLDCMGRLALLGAELSADGEVALACERASVEVRSLSPTRADLGPSDAVGFAARASRASNGRLRMAGIEWIGGGAPREPAAGAAASSSGPGFPWTLASARVERGTLAFEDAAVEPEARFEVALESLAIGPLAFDPSEPTPETELRLVAQVPGVVRGLEIAGEVRVDPLRVDAGMALDARGIELSRLDPYLAAAGLASTLGDGRFQARIDAGIDLGAGGSIGGDVTLSATLTNGRELFALDRCDVRGFRFEPEPLRLQLGSIDVDGLRLDVRRDGESALHALGLALRASRDRGDGASDVPAAQSKPITLPRIDVARLALSGARLAYSDRGVDPPIAADVTLALELDSIEIGAGAARPGHFTAELSAHPFVRRAVLDGTVAGVGNGVAASADLALAVEGIDATALAPQLAPLGIEPALSDGSLSLYASLYLPPDDSTWQVSADVADVVLLEGGDELASVESVHVSGARFGASSFDCAGIAVVAPHVRVARDARGALELGGLRFVPRLPSEPAAPEPWLERVHRALGAFTMPDPPIWSVEVQNAHLDWADRAVDPAIECCVRVGGRVRGVGSHAGLEPTGFELTASVEDALDELTLVGSAAVAPGERHLEGELHARGARAGPLAAYLPTGVRATIADGRLDCGFTLWVSPAVEGGHALLAKIDGLALRDGERRLASLDRAGVAVPRFDAAARVVDVDSVEMVGLQASLERVDRSTWRALGVEFAASASAGAPRDVAAARRPTAKSDAPLPRVSLGRLDLDLARLEIVDPTLSAPPIVASARLSTDAPLELLDADPKELAPFELHARAAVEGVVREIALEARIAPYLARPELALDVTATGIRGDGVLALAPASGLAIDGSALTDGVLAAKLRAELALDRASPVELDLAKPFGAAVELAGLAFRAAPDGEVLAGLESVQAELPRIDLATGDVHVKSIEVTRPIGRASRDAAGWHALGLTIALPPEPEDEARPAPPEVAAEPASGQPVPASTDIRIDKLTVSGLDFALRDASSDPPVELALDALDLEIKRFSTRGLREGAPVSFAAFVGAGDVELPPRAESDSLLEGVAGAAAAAIAGEPGRERGLERRPLFDEAAIAGRVAVAPELSGWATFDLAALELQPLRGLASDFGVTLGDGVLDQSVRVRFQGQRGAAIDARSTFSYLSLSEPAAGPIERYLSLPAPLDTVLFLLEDYEGQHKVPLSFRLTSAGVSGGEIARAATGAAAVVIATAVASSPLRLASTVTDLFGITGGAAKRREVSERVEFEAGASTLDQPARERLERFATAASRKTRVAVAVVHEFGAADVERAARLASPDLDECRQLLMRLRNQRAETAREQAETAAEARASLASGDAAGARAASERMRALDAELGLSDDALERLQELMRPEAAKRRDKRGRNAALAIASDRVERVRQALLDAGLAPERIEVRQIRVALDPGVDTGRVTLVERRRD